jgi:hypothetical protein
MKIHDFIYKLRGEKKKFALIVGKGTKVSVAYLDDPCLCPYKLVTFDLKKDKIVSRQVKKPKTKKQSFTSLGFSSSAVSLIKSVEIVKTNNLTDDLSWVGDQSV